MSGQKQLNGVSGAMLTARGLSISPSVEAHDIEFEHKGKSLLLLEWDGQHAAHIGGFCS